MQPVLDRLRQRQHALTLPNWAWTVAAKAMVWHEIQAAVEEITHLREQLAGEADAALAVWARALKAEQENERLRLEVARLTLRSSDALDSVAVGDAGGGRSRSVPAVGPH